ncbi:Rap30/74 interaction domain-containing protein [Thermothelomyces heterothallicus CBS 203.75]
MSAPPPPPPGNGPVRPPVRPHKPTTANPLVARKKPRPKPQFSRPPSKVPGKGLEEKQKPVLNDMSDPAMRQLAQIRAQNGGWTEKAPPNYKDFPLVMTKRSMLEGLRHHIMRLSKNKGDSSRGKSDAIVDITNQDQFPRPVTLLRRDPRLPPAHRMVVKEESAPTDPAEAAEYERARQLKAEKEAQRALDQAQIAPVLKTNEPKPKSNKKEKPTAFYGRNSDAQKKESKIHYEETWPWHLEDAEGKAGVWVGSYVASLSDLNVALVIDGARFRMIPLERYYKFDEKPKFDTLSLDDAEKMMYEVKEIKRWVMKQKDQEQLEREKNETRQFLRGPTRVKTESETSRLARRTERQDDFELDMSGDEFQDDDEAPGFERDEDEDAKEAKERIRREQVSANTFGEGEEEEVEREERERQLEKLRAKMIGKRTVKTLRKLEHGQDYDDLESGSDENNPFTEESASDEEESEKESDREDEESKKAGAKDQSASGANTRGSTTPSGKQRTVDALKKGKLKRPGSPNMSESSDNEAMRKKVKTTQGSVGPSRGGTPIPGRPKPPSGAMSDGEATAGEGSDAGAKLKKKLKVKPGMRPGATPSDSRAGSPAPAANRAPKPGGATPSGSPPPGGQAPDIITAKEIADALAPYAKEGISLSNLMKKFQGRVNKPGNINTSQWVQMVKAHGVYGPDKLLRPKAALSGNTAQSSSDKPQSGSAAGR